MKIRRQQCALGLGQTSQRQSQGEKKEKAQSELDNRLSTGLDLIQLVRERSSRPHPSAKKRRIDS